MAECPTTSSEWAETERLQRAQVLLDLFEQDCGRAAVTLKEVGVWALENYGHLDFRIEHRLAELAHRNSENSKQQADPVLSFRRRPRRARIFLRRIFGAN